MRACELKFMSVQTDLNRLSPEKTGEGLVTYPREGALPIFTATKDATPVLVHS